MSITSILIAISAPLLISLSAITAKTIVRFRICSSAYTGWGAGAACGILGLILAAVTRTPFPLESVTPMAGLVVLNVAALWLLNRSIQEGDVSTVMPVMGMKTPFAALLSFLLLGERHGPAVYAAVVLSAIAVLIFGAGRQKKAQGGHSHNPVVAILFALAAALGYCLADLCARTAMQNTTPFTVITWSWIFSGIICGAMLAHPGFRQYRLEKIDLLLFGLNGGLMMAGIGMLFLSFKLMNSVTIPNVIFGLRGVFTLAAGYMLSRILGLAIEKQPPRVYALRLAGTALITLSIVLILLGGS